MSDFKHGYTAQQIGDALDITTRRVRQLAEDGVFIRVERGLYDCAQTVNAYLAYRILPSEKRRGASALTLSAYGWLIGHEQVKGSDLKLWRGLVKSLGYTREDSEAAMANAVRLYGDKAPEFV